MPLRTITAALRAALSISPVLRVNAAVDKQVHRPHEPAHRSGRARQPEPAHPGDVPRCECPRRARRSRRWRHAHRNVSYTGEPMGSRMESFPPDTWSEWPDTGPDENRHVAAIDAAPGCRPSTSLDACGLGAISLERSCHWQTVMADARKSSKARKFDTNITGRQ